MNQLMDPGEREATAAGATLHGSAARCSGGSGKRCRPMTRIRSGKVRTDVPIHQRHIWTAGCATSRN